MNCFNSSTEEEVMGECNGRLQHKVWKPGKLRLELKCNGSEGSGKLWYKVWNLGDWALDAYDLDVIIFLPWESDAGAPWKSQQCEKLVTCCGLRKEDKQS